MVVTNFKYGMMHKFYLRYNVMKLWIVVLNNVKMVQYLKSAQIDTVLFVKNKVFCI